MATERSWPLRDARWIDVAWVLFAIANLVTMLLFESWETVPFHFIWVSLTFLYGFRVWPVGTTLLVLAGVCVLTGSLILVDVAHGTQSIYEFTEVPLMSAMFLAMVWHARRRVIAISQLERMNEENRRILDRERRFIQDASHELRTPITVALGHAELIQKSTTDPIASQDVGVIVGELMRLRRLSDRLLILAASEHTDFLRRVPVDADSIVLDALNRWTPVQRRWALGDLEDVTVDADPDRLALALDALIENAVKHTRPEDAISISVRRRNGSAIIGVADSGAGIAPEDLGLIFDRFARSDPGRTRNGGGVGLGLAIVKAVAEAHGGSVAVRSEPGNGSEFELIVPSAGVHGGAPVHAGATASGASPAG